MTDQTYDPKLPMVTWRRKAKGRGTEVDWEATAQSFEVAFMQLRARFLELRQQTVDTIHAHENIQRKVDDLERRAERNGQELNAALVMVDREVTQVQAKAAREAKEHARTVESMRAPQDKFDFFFFFFFNDKKYESDRAQLTGRELRALIPDLDPSWAIFEQGRGHDPDRQIGDDTTIDLTKQHSGPKRFFAVPPATFGR